VPAVHDASFAGPLGRAVPAAPPSHDFDPDVRLVAVEIDDTLKRHDRRHVRERRHGSPRRPRSPACALREKQLPEELLRSSQTGSANVPWRSRRSSTGCCATWPVSRRGC
jgi:hypothetical protein